MSATVGKKMTAASEEEQKLSLDKRKSKDRGEEKAEHADTHTHFSTCSPTRLLT